MVSDIWDRSKRKMKKRRDRREPDEDVPRGNSRKIVFVWKQIVIECSGGPISFERVFVGQQEESQCTKCVDGVKNGANPVGDVKDKFLSGLRPSMECHD